MRRNGDTAPPPPPLINTNQRDDEECRPDKEEWGHCPPPPPLLTQTSEMMRNVDRIRRNGDTAPPPPLINTNQRDEEECRPDEEEWGHCPRPHPLLTQTSEMMRNVDRMRRNGDTAPAPSLINTNQRDEEECRPDEEEWGHCSPILHE